MSRGLMSLPRLRIKIGVFASIEFVQNDWPMRERKREYSGGLGVDKAWVIIILHGSGVLLESGRYFRTNVSEKS